MTDISGDLVISVPTATSAEIIAGVEENKAITPKGISDSISSPAIRKLLRNIPDIFDYGGTLSGDNTAAFNLAFGSSGVIADGKTQIYLPSGNYAVGTQLDDVDYPINIVGDHMSSSVIIFSHTGNGLKFTGNNGTGGSAKDFSLVYDCGSGNTAGDALTLKASSAGKSPDFFYGEGINITSFSGLMGRGVFIDGTDRASPLLGIRNITLRNFPIFNCTVKSIEIQQGRSVVLDRMGIYQASGTTSEILVTGPNNTLKSSGIIFTSHNGGTVSLDRVDAFRGYGIQFGFTHTANSTDYTWA